MTAARLTLSLLWGLGLASPLAGQHTLTLADGDRITGRLRAIEGATWVFRFRDQRLRVPVTHVRAFATETPIGLRLQSGEITATLVVPTPAGLRIDVDGSPRTVTPADFAAVGDADDLAALRPVRIGFLSPFTRFWEATLSFGLSDKSGNSRARGISGTVDVNRRTDHDRVTVGFGFNREQSEGGNGQLETTVSKYYGHARLDVFVRPRLFVFGATRQERDRFQNIALRSTYTAGFGLQAVTNARSDLSFSFAGGARREALVASANGTETHSVAAVGTVLRHDFGPATLAWTIDFSPRLNALGDFRLVSDAAVTAPVFFGIGFRLGVLNEHTSRPPPGIGKNDTLISTTLSYSIGR